MCKKGVVMWLPNLGALSLNALTSADASGVADGDREDRPILLDDSDDEVVVLNEDDGNDTEPGEDDGNDTEPGEEDVQTEWDEEDVDTEPGEMEEEDEEEDLEVVEGKELENVEGVNEAVRMALLKRDERRERQRAADEAAKKVSYNDNSGDFKTREDEEAYLKMERELEEAREKMAKQSNKERKKPKKTSLLDGLGRTATPKPKEPDTSAADKEAALKKEARNAKRRAQYAAKKARAAEQADASRPEVPQEDASRPEVPQEVVEL